MTEIQYTETNKMVEVPKGDTLLEEGNQQLMVQQIIDELVAINYRLDNMKEYFSSENDKSCLKIFEPTSPLMLEGGSKHSSSNQESKKAHLFLKKQFIMAYKAFINIDVQLAAVFKNKEYESYSKDVKEMLKNCNRLLYSERENGCKASSFFSKVEEARATMNEADNVLNALVRAAEEDEEHALLKVQLANLVSMLEEYINKFEHHEEIMGNVDTHQFGQKELMTNDVCDEEEIDSALMARNEPGNLNGLLFDFSLLQESTSIRKDIKDEAEKLSTALSQVQHELKMKTDQLDDMMVGYGKLECCLSDSKATVAEKQMVKDLQKAELLSPDPSSSKCLMSLLLEKEYVIQQMEKEMNELKRVCSDIATVKGIWVIRRSVELDIGYWVFG
ncbi:hypothetical protein Tco_1083477 [Tanacetum coccineum]